MSRRANSRVSRPLQARRPTLELIPILQAHTAGKGEAIVLFRYML
jgi:hypothetical protein